MNKRGKILLVLMPILSKMGSPGIETQGMTLRWPLGIVLSFICILLTVTKSAAM